MAYLCHTHMRTTTVGFTMLHYGFGASDADLNVFDYDVRICHEDVIRLMLHE